MRLVMRQQRRAIGGQAEEIARLLDPGDGRTRRRDLGAVWPVAQLALVVESLIPDRVPAGIAAEIDCGLAVRRLRLGHLAPQRLRRVDVPLLGGPDEI